jgi:hypothetical protein
MCLKNQNRSLLSHRWLGWLWFEEVCATPAVRRCQLAQTPRIPIDSSQRHQTSTRGSRTGWPNRGFLYHSDRDWKAERNRKMARKTVHARPDCRQAAPDRSADKPGPDCATGLQGGWDRGTNLLPLAQGIRRPADGAGRKAEGSAKGERAATQRRRRSHRGKADSQGHRRQGWSERRACRLVHQPHGTQALSAHSSPGRRPADAGDRLHGPASTAAMAIGASRLCCD